MEKNKLYILTEGGVGIGFGHITRCVALYEKAIENNLEVKFIVFGSSIEEVLKNYDHEIKDWKDSMYLLSFITNKDLVIVDSYLANFEICDLISKLAKRVLFIDDNMRLDYPRGIVVNPTLYGNELNYPKNKKIKYLLGKEFIILRKEFNNRVDRKEKIKKNLFLITLGGTDLHNLIPKLIKMIKKINKNYEINVIVNKNFHNFKEIKKLSSSNVKLFFNLTAIEMVNIMEKSNFVISACGQTVYELIKLGIPFLPIQVAQNQLKNKEYLDELKFTTSIYNDEKLFKKLNLALNYFEKKLVLKTNGTELIINELISG